MQANSPLSPVVSADGHEALVTRINRLESSLDAIASALATRADLADLRAIFFEDRAVATDGFARLHALLGNERATSKAAFNTLTHLTKTEFAEGRSNTKARFSEQRADAKAEFVESRALIRAESAALRESFSDDLADFAEAFHAAMLRNSRGLLCAVGAALVGFGGLASAIGCLIYRQL